MASIHLMVKVALELAKVEVWFEALVRRLRFLPFGVFDCLISYRDYSRLLRMLQTRSSRSCISFGRIRQYPRS